MKVKLSSCPNPDYRQTEAPAPSQVVEVESLEEASKVCRAYITEHELGGGNWSGGDVLDDSGQKIARISYNGRIWEGVS